MICGKCDEDKHPSAFQPCQLKKPTNPYCRNCLKKPRSKNPDPKLTWRGSHQQFFASPTK